ncbi:hypothetical protein R1flu_006294 [Riccia fluitans]|uniref:Uncharacterized protein n=1 Tax=Riccia fluitans TaxID=41844 RepID=A0ABD1YVX3_9MARC
MKEGEWLVNFNPIMEVLAHIRWYCLKLEDVRAAIVGVEAEELADLGFHTCFVWSFHASHSYDAELRTGSVKGHQIQLTSLLLAEVFGTEAGGKRIDHQVRSKKVSDWFANYDDTRRCYCVRKCGKAEWQPVFQVEVVMASHMMQSETCMISTTHA